MDNNRLVLELGAPEKGAGDSDEHVDVSIVAQKMQQFVNLLQHSTPEKYRENVSFKLVNLSYAGPVNVECKAQSKHPEQVASTLNCVRENLDSVCHEKYDNLSDAVLLDFRDLFIYKENHIGSLAIQLHNGSNDPKIYSPHDLSTKALNSYLDTEESYLSSVSGKLERANIRNSANTFRILPSMPNWEFVDCKFPLDLLKEVGSAFGGCVSVDGIVFCRGGANLPYRMEVHSMEILPPSEELPSLRDLWGIAPNLTGGLTAEEYVQRQRDEWGSDSE